MTDRLRAAVMGTPAERDLDALLKQLEALRGAAQELDDLNPTLGAFVHDDLWGAAARKLHAVLVFYPASVPLNVDPYEFAESDE